MPTNFTSLPIIDISGLFSASLSDRKKVAFEIRSAATTAGFFYVIGHGIAREERDALCRVAKRFFARPVTEKMRSFIGQSSNHTGYVPEGEEVFYGQKPDRKEAYDISIDAAPGTPLPDGRPTPMLGPVQWPDDREFREVVGGYYSAVSSLARRMFCGFALALDLPEDYFEAHLKCPPSQLRLIHYPHQPDAPADQPGIGAHTDYECFTILTGTAPGLEVMNGAGEWIDAPPIPDAYVINIGDLLEAWSNGVFIATSHRVRKVKEERYSFPFFATCDYHTVVAPLPQFVTPERPAKFEPIVSGEHLLAQTAQTFNYLKTRIADGTFKLPEGAFGLSSFGQEARNRKAG